jgi:hypothetical protein
MLIFGVAGAPEIAAVVNHFTVSERRKKAWSAALAD